MPHMEASSSHYEQPPCLSDELAVRIEGGQGEVCAPKCTESACPTDVPEGTTAKPQCALKDRSTGDKYCALLCQFGGCPKGATCQHPFGQAGVCMYPAGTEEQRPSVQLARQGPAPGTSPPLLTPPTSPSSSHYEQPPCLSDELAVQIEGGQGEVCAPKCTESACPTDVPEGTTARPQCALEDQSTGDKYCALLCLFGGCPPGAKCQHPGGQMEGVCMYPADTEGQRPVARLARQVQGLINV